VEPGLCVEVILYGYSVIGARRMNLQLANRILAVPEVRIRRARIAIREGDRIAVIVLLFSSLMRLRLLALALAVL
jgi:translation initiation factor IF-1